MLSAQTIAILYDLHLAGVWRGEDAVSPFARWLEDRWSVNAATEPERPADAVSRLGNGGDGIRWYDAGDELLGFLSARLGCYVVHRTDLPPQLQGAASRRLA